MFTMCCKNIIISVILIGIIIHNTMCLEFGEFCIKSPDDCENEKNLACTEVGPGEFRCYCDIDSFYYLEDTCVKYSTKPGERCYSESEQCSRIEGCSCENSVCSCSGEYFEYPVGQQCTEYANYLHDLCSFDEGANHCFKLNGTKCQKNDDGINTCECSEEDCYFEFNDSCLTFSNLVGEPCVNEQQCEKISNSTCFENSCTCQNGTFADPRNTKCLGFNEELGDQCEPETIQCSLISEAECLLSALENQYVCGCRESEFFEYENECISYANHIGDSCVKETMQCAKLSNSICANSTCTCSEGYVPSMGKEKCLKVSSFGEDCDEPTQCELHLGQFATCLSTCQCQDGSSFLENKCWKKINLSNLCTADTECHAGVNFFAYCINGFCKCHPDAIEFNGTTCLEKFLIGDYCRHPSNCSPVIEGGAFCDPYTRVCTCPLGAFPNIEKNQCSSSTKVTNTISFFIFFILFACNVTKIQKIFH